MKAIELASSSWLRRQSATWRPNASKRSSRSSIRVSTLVSIDGSGEVQADELESASATVSIDGAGDENGKRIGQFGLVIPAFD